jgi:hypothetical protein
MPRTLKTGFELYDRRPGTPITCQSRTFELAARVALRGAPNCGMARSFPGVNLGAAPLLD